ncbi:MAG: radical SAM protein [Deltaproteobacteria bacterium]|nr:radical SAM protein [Deltaproteobacteria bacterium]
MNHEQLQISEIYDSIQGESSWAGWPCTFIRLTGCPLRCRWCDTAHAFKGGETLSVSEILDRVRALSPRLVELTGGEPLAQEGVLPLMHALASDGYELLMETGGSLSLKQVPDFVNVVMDLKCPDSGMSEHNCYDNIRYLKKTDEVKFVIASEQDFLWAFDKVREYKLSSLCKVLMSPAWGLVSPEDLVRWMLESGVQAKLNLQLHKFIWHPRKKGV